ncbi:MAG: tetratricopeptide repeat protein [bacterium]
MNNGVYPIKQRKGVPLMNQKGHRPFVHDTVLMALLAAFSLIMILYCAGEAWASIDHSSRQPAAPVGVIEKTREEEKHKEALEYYKMGEHYSKLGKVNEAIDEYRKALNLDPNLAEAHLNLGWSYALRKKDYDLALQETLEAIRLKPEFTIAYRNLWWIYRLQKNYDKALETLKKILSLEPDNPINYLNLGEAYIIDTKDIPRAITILRQGLDRDPNNFHILRKLGKAYEFDAQYDRALGQYEKALERNPSDPYTYLFMAVTLGKAGKASEIPPLMKKAIASIAEKLAMPVRWDLSLLKFYAGNISEEDLFAQGKLNPIHRCQALYYAGLKRIWEGNTSKGIEYLTECRSMGIDALAEYEYSRTELSLLKAKIP